MRNSPIHRVLDVAIVVAASPLVVPLCLVLMVWIRRDSPGDALFVQTRVGRGQIPFRLYKLRTMARNTGDRPSHQVSRANITPLGKVLRRTKLDELPQLWNILKGDMAFVGPRPCLPSQQTLIEERAARGLFDILPGITGPAQLQGIDMSTPVLMADVEAAYFRGSTMRSDLQIIFETLTGAGSGDAAGEIQ